MIDLDELDPSDHRPLVLSADEVRALRRLARIGAAVEAEIQSGAAELIQVCLPQDDSRASREARDAFARILEAGK